MTLEASLVSAWAQWEHHPSHEREANLMEDACGELAGALGVRTTDLRVSLSGARRRSELDGAITDGELRRCVTAAIDEFRRAAA